MKRFAIIQAHNPAIETVKRHLSIWRKTSNGQLFVCSRGDRLDAELGVEQMEIGPREHHGIGLALRILMIAEIALSIDWDVLELHEYDSFLLSPLEPPAGGMAAISYPQNKPGKFRSKFYLHYPHVYSREALVALTAELQAIFIENNKDRYWSDRFIGWAAERAKIPVRDLRSSGEGYSQNTILPEHREEVTAATKQGAIAFHGVKDGVTLTSILKTHRLTKQS